MTENKAQKWLERFEWDDSEETIEALATICEALQEYPKFKAIGTIEEFKALKENQRKCEDCAGCTNWKCDCANERNQAIDDFAERLKEVCSKNAMAIDRETNKPLYGKDGVWQDLIDDIAEEMRCAE